MGDLKDITTRLGRAYTADKETEQELDAVKTEFYTAASTQIAESQTLARKTVDLSELLVDDPEEYIATMYPGWRIVDPGPREHTWIIEEDPDLLKFVWVDPDTAMMYQRIVRESKPGLDDQRLALEDFPLWCRITECPEELVLHQLATEAGGDLVPRVIEKYIEKHEHEFARYLKPLASLSAADLAAVADYLVPGSLSLTLGPPRKAKPEEL